MKVVCVNYTFDSRLTDPEVLLDRYDTLVGWAEGLSAAGVDVLTIQRFAGDSERTRHDVPFQFVRDPALKDGSVIDAASRIHAAVAAAKPDLVHVNGLQFARQARRLSRALGVPILVQDHGNPPPQYALERWDLGRSLRQMDAVSFVSREQAEPWVDAGLLRREQTIVEIMEGSSRFQMTPQAEARAATRLAGEPLCLWVGHLNENKDPLTVLQGFGQALESLLDAHLVMIYQNQPLLPKVQEWLAKNPVVARRVQLLGRVPHEELENIYNSADIFVLGSHKEGSGYAVLEALSCGVTPVVSAIPSFRILTANGEIGSLWLNGDAQGMAQALTERYGMRRPDTREQVRAYFDHHFRWDAIGRTATAAYRRVLR